MYYEGGKDKEENCIKNVGRRLINFQISNQKSFKDLEDGVLFLKVRQDFLLCGLIFCQDYDFSPIHYFVG